MNNKAIKRRIKSEKEKILRKFSYGNNQSAQNIGNVVVVLSPEKEITLGKNNSVNPDLSENECISESDTLSVSGEVKSLKEKLLEWYYEFRPSRASMYQQHVTAY